MCLMHRLLVHGSLAPRSQDRQRTSSWASRLSFIAFIVMVPLLHWAAVIRYVGGGSGTISYDGCTPYDLLGSALMLGAIRLTSVASQQLGKVRIYLEDQSQRVFGQT